MYLCLQIYCIKQSNETSTKEINEQLLVLDREYNELVDKVKDLKHKIKTKTDTITKMESMISIEEAEEKKLTLDKEIESVKLQLENFNGDESVCPNRKIEVEKEYDKYLKEYKQRKRICMDMLNVI